MDITSKSRGLFGQKLLPRLGVIAAVLLVLGIFGYYVSVLLEKKVQDIINEQLERLKKKYGLVVHVDTVDVGFGEATLQRVVVGDSGWLAVDRAVISISLNPFSDFLRPDSIAIGNGVIAISSERRNWPSDLKKLSDRIFNGVNRKSGASKGSGYLLLPKRLTLRAKKISLIENDRPWLVVEDAATTLQIRERRVAVRVAQVIAFDRIKESFLESEVSLLDDGDLRMNLRGRPDFKGRPLWSTSCMLVRNPLALRCDVDADRLPDLSLTFFKSRLGRAFAPGYRGGVGFESLDGSSLKKLRITTRGVVENIAVEHPALAGGPVGPINVRSKMDFDVDVEQKTISAARSDLFAYAPGAEDGEGINISTEFSLKFEGGGRTGWLPSGNFQMDVNNVDCGVALDTIPQSFLPELIGFRLQGTAALHTQIRLDQSGAQFSIAGSQFNCSVVKSPEMYSAEYLQGPFVIERETPDGKINIPVDPDRPYYVAYKDIPQLVRSAFVSSEDTGFFSHQGVELGAIVGAVERNAEAKKPAVGGSTITMQTVKNLFLARDKTLSRKVQEMFLAWHLERTISKERILEIYLNMVEFGPGLYGIGRASQKFFSKDAADLTLKEAIYLASLLPAPVPRYRYFCKGELTPNYNRILKQLLDRMLTLGRITVGQHAQAVAEKIEFSKIEREAACVSSGGDQDGASRADY